MPDDSTVSSALPIIDLSPLDGGSDAELDALGKELRDACESWGFAYFINHGIPQEDINAMLDTARRFFDLPIEVKAKVRKPDVPGYQPGWVGPGAEQVHEAVRKMYPKEMVEGWGKLGEERWEAFLAVLDKDDMDPNSRFGNLWPDEGSAPGFQDRYTSTAQAFQQLSLRVMSVIERSLHECPPGWLTSKHQRSGVTRIAKYHKGPWDKFAAKDKSWLAPHTDNTTCSFVVQGGPGLEVERPGKERGVFVPADAVPDSIVFNVGDLLERMSNDLFKSTVHRVNPPPPAADEEVPDRVSFIYFASLDSGLNLDYIPGTWSEERPKRYPVVDLAEFRMRRFRVLDKEQGGLGPEAPIPMGPESAAPASS